MYGFIYLIFIPEDAGVSPSSYNCAVTDTDPEDLNNFQKALTAEGSKIAHLNGANNVHHPGQVMRGGKHLQACVRLLFDPTSEELTEEKMFEDIPQVFVEIHCWVTVTRTDEKRLKPGSWRETTFIAGILIYPDPSKEDSRRMRIIVKANTLVSARLALIGVLEGTFRPSIPWII